MELLRKKQAVPVATLSDWGTESEVSASPVSTIPGSPASSDSDRLRGISFRAIKDKARKSFGRGSPPNPVDQNEALEKPKTHSRKLSKTHAQSAAIEILNRRNSTFSDDRSVLSRSSTTRSLSSASSIDWKSQTIEGAAPLWSDPGLLKAKTPYMVVSSDYILKMRSRSETLSLFPQLAPDVRPKSPGSHPDPLLCIPICDIVSVFAVDTNRPAAGIEIWWSQYEMTEFRHTVFCFNHQADQEDQMARILDALRSHKDRAGSSSRCSWHVEVPIRRIFAAEEPAYQHHTLEIFPVALRGATRRDALAKGEDKTAKSLDGRAFYLVIGANLCFLVDVRRKSKRQAELCTKHSSFGLVSLECVEGDWAHHQESFNVTFREPFNAPVTLELASRYYRQIIRVLGKADRFLKPAWPQTWQNLEIFRVYGLKEQQYLVPRDNYGSFHRTLEAYIAAYKCGPLEWEINWRTQYAPEFRLLPPKNGSRYSPTQLLAVLRALRYNDYFRSLSFRDVDLTILYDLFDCSPRRGCVAYLSRSCVALGPDEVESLQLGPVLQNEFHALAFCSETVRQMDLTNTFRAFPFRASASATVPRSVQFLSPILNLLRTGSSKCNRLLLSGNALSPADIVEIIHALEMGLIQALDISRCGLCDMDLRELFHATGHSSQPLQLLDISGNMGRIPAHMVPHAVSLLGDLRELNLCGCLLGDLQGPLLPFEVLERLPCLEELDISNYKVNDATIEDLERFLLCRARGIDSNEELKFSFRRLVLNNCGITGRQAARLFNAIGEDRGVHLFLNGNPLEDGIEELADAIRRSRGPVGLNMDMVEFRDEANYVLLIRALTQTKYLSLLSLVGTSPTPSPSVPCSRETLQALEDFFAHNKSINYLDLSGFCGKLDDGQLAKGFGRSLQGLARNTTITHFWIRNQNLQDEAGTLGTVFRQNKTLVKLDCQQNGFNLTGLQFLVQSLKENHTIVEFPFSEAERESTWKRIISELQASQQKTTDPKTARHRVEEQQAALRVVFEQLFADLDAYLYRNRAELRQALDPRPEFEPSFSPTRETWPTDLWLPSGEGTSSGTDKVSRRATVYSSAMLIDTSVSAPYQVYPEEGTESPTEVVGLIPGGYTTPPELVGPHTPEDDGYQGLLQEFKEAVSLGD
ncbi:hypothetical protein VTK73DRAFT_3671 [Phialemonium thermophilum]|uniref:LRR-containing protein second PH domain-containing protein n=1 Tax=Phialemonium thermophilum TaxID=223376 RepID=A0ABR3WY70_9PEZI